MKEHATAAGITLSMKNLFGITPNSLYGSGSAGEENLGYRGPIHGKAEGWVRPLPGEKPGLENEVVGVRVPRTIVDENLARPVHLAIVDGIRTIRGGEGWWNARVSPIDPGVVVAGFNALSTDAVAAAVMGFDPRAAHYTAPFETRENHLLIAEEAGLGTADLDRIEVRGLRIADVRTPFRSSSFRWEPQPALGGPRVPIG
jgi:uncharacterized protein (DUF362 family)